MRGCHIRPKPPWGVRDYSTLGNIDPKTSNWPAPPLVDPFPTDCELADHHRCSSVPVPSLCLFRGCWMGLLRGRDRPDGSNGNAQEDWADRHVTICLDLGPTGAMQSIWVVQFMNGVETISYIYMHTQARVGTHTRAHTYTHTHLSHKRTCTRTYIRTHEEGTSESLTMQCSRISLPMGRSSRGPHSASFNQMHARFRLFSGACVPRPPQSLPRSPPLANER